MARISIDLDGKTAEALIDWMARMTYHGNLPGLTEAEAIPAIIRVSLRHDHATDLVASQLQHERATARDRGD